MTLVPTLSVQQDITLPNGCTLTIDNTQFFPIVFRGDQLTVARVHGTEALRETHDSPIDRLEGVVPVVEDWHARMCKHIYVLLISLIDNVESGLEKGTMHQLHNVIHRTSVPLDPQKNMNVAEDFMLLLLYTHIRAYYSKSRSTSATGLALSRHGIAQYP